MKNWLIVSRCLIFFAPLATATQDSWIRINLLGYTPGGLKVAVWCSKSNDRMSSFQLVDATSGKVVFENNSGKAFGAYGPFSQSSRLNFTSFTGQGRFFLKAGEVISPEFNISDNVYAGAANFCLRYMRQQRSGFNPFLKDSCHARDGYTMYGPMPDSTHIDASGGWHDASDYLQYSSTSANATWHLLAAYRDFPKKFPDQKLANGLEGTNGQPDILDEAKWGLDWLLKMHPTPRLMFNQLADDRDHMGMRIPGLDTFYGKGYERPVYFLNGLPQQRGKFMNNTTGTSSTAGKFSSAFALGSELFRFTDPRYAEKLKISAFSALDYAGIKHGAAQTVSVRSPYIYAEDNWFDDMELAFASVNKFTPVNKKGLIDSSYKYAQAEKITPWLGRDTANHYQWYPFINAGHYELAKQLNGSRKDEVINFYKEGIEKVWKKAEQNAFLRGVPFIWCSNNLTTSFAIQCYWYRTLSKDEQYSELEQANFDWLFGCNPWGTSFVYGLPSFGDTPRDPHSAFTHLKNYPIDGGLVDGPVYGNIYKKLLGITLYQPDEYADFQSDLVVYHDDYGDYSTNEPTMDGTASLIYLLAAKEQEQGISSKSNAMEFDHGAIIRGDSSKKQIALIFTGDEFADGGEIIAEALKNEKIKASFFLTGRFYRNPRLRKLIQKLKYADHYLGPHSDQHLLYSDWKNRDSLFVTKNEFNLDIDENISAMQRFGLHRNNTKNLFFIPPYEWWNDTIASGSKAKKLQLFNFTPGTLSQADYTWPELKNYRNSDVIFQSIVNYEKSNSYGMNGAILLLHIGTDPRRSDKFYRRLPALIRFLKSKKYKLVTIDKLVE